MTSHFVCDVTPILRDVITRPWRHAIRHHWTLTKFTTTFKGRHPYSGDVIFAQVTSSLVTSSPLSVTSSLLGQVREPPLFDNFVQLVKIFKGNITLLRVEGAGLTPVRLPTNPVVDLKRSLHRKKINCRFFLIYSLPRPATLVNWMVYDSRISFSQKTAVFFEYQFCGFFT